MTTTDITAIRARLLAATPGLWRARRQGQYWVVETELPCINGLSAWFVIAVIYEPDAAEIGYTDGAIGDAEDRADLIAHAPADIAALLTAYAEQAAEVERLRADWIEERAEGQRQRFAACAADPRLFVRHLRAEDHSQPSDYPRDPEGPLYNLSEGQAVEMLAEREKRAVDRAVLIAAADHLAQIAALTAAAEGARAAALETEPSAEAMQRAVRAFEAARSRKVDDMLSVSPTEHPDDGGGPIGYGIRAAIRALAAAPATGDANG